MIIKGNRHGNGAKLAAYLMDGGKHGERVAEPELYGFAAEDIADAFRDLHSAANVRGIENPLFHIQIRLPQGEQMTPAQWDTTTARVLKTAGLEGQPYARVFHTDEKTGELHCHLGVSLIDEQTHKAKALPFYKLRFKALARKLEEEFDLTRVKNHRDSAIKYGATKAEEQQAQRLGFSKEGIRNTIRQCWDSADCGHSFEAALADTGLILAQGDRGHGNYLVIDPQGGLHVLGKRILDATAAQVRERLADLDRDNLPTVESARAFLLDLPRDRVEKLTRELAELERQVAAEHDEIQWQQALERAAIEKEEREGKFAEQEKETRGGAAAAKEPEAQPEPDITELLKRQLAEVDKLLYGGLTPDEQKRKLDDLDKFLAAELYERAKKYPNHFRTHWQDQIPSTVAAEIERLAAAEAEREYARRDPAREETAWQDAVDRAAIAKEQREREFVEPRPAPATPAREETQAGRQQKEQQPLPIPPNLKGPGREIWIACAHSDSAKAFAAALDEKRIALAITNQQEAHRSHMTASFAKQVERFSPEYREGEVVAVTLEGQVFKLSQRNTGKTRQEMEAFLAPLDRNHLQGIEATKQSQERRLHERHWPTMPQQPDKQASATGLRMQDAPPTSRVFHFQDAARQTQEPDAAPAPPANFRGIAAEIWTAYNIRQVDREWPRENPDGTKETNRDRITLKGGRDPLKFGQALDERGLILARATKEEAEQSQKDAEHWKGFGAHRPVYREGEFVVIDRRGEVWKLTERTTGHSAKEAQSFLNKAEWKALPGIEAARETMKTRMDERLIEARDRAAHWDAIRSKNAGRKHGRGQGRTGQAAAPDLARASGRAIGGVIGALGKLADGFSLDALTPKEKYEAAKRDARNEREADTNADYAAYMAALAEQRRRDQHRQAEDRQRREPERER